MRIKIPGLLRNAKFLLGLSIFIAIVLTGVVGPGIYTISPRKIVGPRYTPPSSQYPLGTDALGRDVLAQLLHGIRGSLIVGATAGLMALSLALFLGTIAAVFGGIVDKIIMSISEIFIILPSILLMMILAAFLPPEAKNLWMVSLVIGVTSWGGWARGFRSRTLSILSAEFINLARLSGASRMSIIVRDIIPIISPYVLAAFAMLFSQAVMSEVGLTIIGIGMTRDVTLGLMLYFAQIYANISQGIWWTFVPPTIVIILIYLSLYSIAISLDEYFAPRLGSV
ncbi:binding-protein-dependent transport systems inner membrane component [Ignisphaera aggregans DSM 17230]|uniref:Binding-protein-dependent transport systems inner membrane component n=1 Tax=Ignisphaera aggregans (strain DSM 17230 / JCM 13409 / AQ1.S1) TaxID=583356 RepID=E0SS37_IGNAA|nr:binding-protein-dependent transport systems inner membrane component [Ignisphaera aggregans DSM 17230]